MKHQSVRLPLPFSLLVDHQSKSKQCNDEELAIGGDTVK